MDLAIGAKDVFVMMTLFAKDGSSKLVPECTYPLTGVACVSRVYTDHGVFEITDDGVQRACRRTAPRWTSSASGPASTCSTRRGCSHRR